MPDPLTSLVLDIRCTLCDQQTPKSLGWLQTHDDLACAHCGAVIDLRRDQIRAEIDKARKALNKTLRGFAKR